MVVSKVLSRGSFELATVDSAPLSALGIFVTFAIDVPPTTPMLPTKPRGVPRVNDRRVLNGIFWILRSGAPWRDLPTAFGPYTTCYNRFVRWRRAGVWATIMSALAIAHDASVQMIDTSIVRVHQHGACIVRTRPVKLSITHKCAPLEEATTTAKC